MEEPGLGRPEPARAIKVAQGRLEIDMDPLNPVLIPCRHAPAHSFLADTAPTKLRMYCGIKQEGMTAPSHAGYAKPTSRSSA